MIFLNQEEQSPIIIDKHLLGDYKRQGDIYLSGIKRNMTRQLTIYTVYKYLQDVYNSYFQIIGSLLDEKYMSLGEVLKDEKELAKQCTLFTKKLEGNVPDNIYQSIIKELENTKLLVRKLVYIIENICYHSELEDN